MCVCGVVSRIQLRSTSEFSTLIILLSHNVLNRIMLYRYGNFFLLYDFPAKLYFYFLFVCVMRMTIVLEDLHSLSLYLHLTTRKKKKREMK